MSVTPLKSTSKSTSKSPFGAPRRVLTPPPNSLHQKLTTGTIADEGVEIPDTDDVFSSPSFNAARRRSSFLGSAARVKTTSRDASFAGYDDDPDATTPAKIPRKLSPVPIGRQMSSSSSIGKENNTAFSSHANSIDGSGVSSSNASQMKLPSSLLGNASRRDSGLLSNAVRSDSSTAAWNHPVR
jgi:hypothetical protein